MADLIVLLILSANIVTEHLMSCLREHEDLFFAALHISTILLNIALFASVWITVVLAVERYIAICHPMQVEDGWVGAAGGGNCNGGGGT